MKLQKAVVDETRKIAVGTAVGAAVMMAVFAVIGRFDSTVVLGTLLGYAAAVLNFFLLCYTVQQAAADIQDESEENIARGKRIMKLSYMWRRMMQAGFIIVALVVPAFNWIAAVFVMVLPSVSIVIRQIFENKRASERTDKPNG